jgi:fibronectin-binding autotransporter adhesin
VYINVPVDPQQSIVCEGGFWNNTYFTTVLLSNSSLVGNTAGRSGAGSGGGLFLVSGGLLTVTGTTISGNSASLFGGGLAIGQGASTCGLLVAQSTVSSNTAHGGSQLYMDATGAVTFESTVFLLGTAGSQV